MRATGVMAMRSLDVARCAAVAVGPATTVFAIAPGSAWAGSTLELSSAAGVVKAGDETTFGLGQGDAGPGVQKTVSVETPDGDVTCESEPFQHEDELKGTDVTNNEASDEVQLGDTATFSGTRTRLQSSPHARTASPKTPSWAPCTDSLAASWRRKATSPRKTAGRSSMQAIRAAPYSRLSRRSVTQCWPTSRTASAGPRSTIHFGRRNGPRRPPDPPHRLPVAPPWRGHRNS